MSASEKEPCEFQFQMDIWKSELWFLSKVRFELADVPPSSHPPCKIDKNLQKMKFSFFGLCSTSDDQPSDMSDKSLLKYKKGP